MFDSGRLGELQRRFDENPRRYFAPLANEYRKAGETDRAIELCRVHLPHQPGHMSGYIVYGQALFDAGRREEAAAVFHEALRIDPENVIALRHLGDIARVSGDAPAATGWYQQVLAVDPKNEEVASYVTALNSQDPVQSAPVAEEELQASSDAYLAFEPTDTPPPTPQTEDMVFDPFGGQFDSQFAVPSADPLAGMYSNGEADEPGPVDEVISSNEVVSSEDAPFGVASDPEPDAFTFPQEDALADSATEFVSLASDVSDPVESVEMQLVPPALPHVTADDDYPPEEAASPQVDSPFVTETMAELYLQQGFLGEALTVYRQLAAQRNEPSLWEKVRELEAKLEAALGDMSDLEEETTASADDAALDADVLGAPRTTVRDFFAHIGARRPDGRSSLRMAAVIDAPEASDAPSVSDPSSAMQQNGLTSLFPESAHDARDVHAASNWAQAYAGAQSARSTFESSSL